MNGDVVVLSFTLTDCLPISYTIRTSTGIADANGNMPSDLNTIKTQAVTAATGVTFPASIGTSTLAAGAKMDLADSLNSTGVADLKSKLGTVPASGNWSTHDAAAVVTALGTGSTLTDCATATGFAVPGSAMALTSGERTTLAAAIEAAIINELDGTAVMQAIADLIASDMTTGDLSVAAIATATRDAILNRVLAGNHDTASTVGLLLQYLDAAISSRHASGAAVAKSPATLDWSADVSNKPTIGTSTFNPATDTVANVTTVATCTTNTDMRGTDSAALAATALSTAVWTNTKAGYIDAAVSGIPTNPMLDTEDGSSFSAIPDMATATNQSTIAGYIDTEVGTIIEHLTDIKGTGFAKDTHSLPQCLTAAGFSTFNAASDKVYLANGAHGGAAASITLADYSDFQGAGGADASTIYTYFTAESRQNAFKADVSGLALEATLTAMKGVGWTDETLKAIRDKLPANLEDLNITDATGLVRPDMANASGNYSGTVATVTTLTNAPADMATATNQTTILNRLGAFTGTGVNTVLGFFKALLSKAATLPTDVGGTFDPATDSTEAIRDRGDSAWITAAGTSTVTTTDIENIVIETGVTLKQALQRVGAVAAGKVSGAGTGTEVFVGMDGTTTRVTVVVDEDGNRSAITYDDA
jgi:hypothetical protein